MRCGGIGPWRDSYFETLEEFLNDPGPIVEISPEEANSDPTALFAVDSPKTAYFRAVQDYAVPPVTL